jgi:hypothetical protein
VVGGSSWLWSREDMQGKVNVLVIDQAGQMALANVCAVAQAASNLVLVGDPQQLEQPHKGVHPEGCSGSALHHLFRGDYTVREGAGLFLGKTWRMAPPICSFNFRPDFIVWLLVGDRQHVVFVDPKGIRNFGATDPKIEFHQTIKEIEQRLGDSNVKLDSFIVSNTPSHTMQKLWNIDKPAMAARHILFQEEDSDTYIGALLNAVVGGSVTLKAT